MPLRYVLWDNDGVLVDTEEGYFLASRRALAECGIRLAREAYMHMRASGGSVWELPEVTGLGRATIERQRTLRDAYYQQFIRGGSHEVAGVRSVLEELSKCYRMAIVTTSKRRDFDAIHRERTLLPYMEFVLTREDFVMGKPSPDGYLAALDRLRADPDDAIVVEDSAQGLNAARAAGLRCVIVRNRFFGSAHAFDGALEVVESIGELPGVMARINAGG